MSASGGTKAIIAALLLAQTLIAERQPAERELGDDRQRDRAAISRLLAEWEVAWNAHDMRRMAAPYISPFTRNLSTLCP